MRDHIRTGTDNRLGTDVGERRRGRFLGVRSVLPPAAVAVVALAAPATAAQASAAQASAGNARPSAAAAAQAIGPDGIPVAELAATCHYRVNHSGGIRIYRQPAVGASWGSFANGATFYSTCANGGGQVYTDCPGPLLSFQWKTVGVSGGHTGYVKTKCLVRI
ncbi:hypothetical protein [Paractinoplanes globisporus]|uniref:Uncharacterized protein n=1 Tax=Paractinoplanes globisporus TaxID=113565 RepID=A0ABW6WBJ6_9ACTN|nr:hypothetical protein [Actinoplanes globisporus]